MDSRKKRRNAGGIVSKLWLPVVVLVVVAVVGYGVNTVRHMFLSADKCGVTSTTASEPEVPAAGVGPTPKIGPAEVEAAPGVITAAGVEPAEAHVAATGV